MPQTPTMDRRRFLVMGTVTGGALLVGCSDLGPAGRLNTHHAQPAREGRVALNAWIALGLDGLVTVVMPKSEMGQGVHTSLLMLVAEELDCGWAAMRHENAPIDRVYGNVEGLAEAVPFRPDDDSLLARSARWALRHTMRQLGLMMTGTSSSVRDLWEPLRNAAAMARATLVEALASSWGVPATEITVADGVFSHAKGRRATLAEAVRDQAGRWTPATRWTLKEPGQFRLIGQPLKRRDALAKIEGRATFGIDVRRPGQLAAVVSLCPTRGGEVATFDASKARGMPGVRAVVAFGPEHGGSGGVAVVADRSWRARKALDAVEVRWNAGAMASVSTGALMDRLRQALDGDDGFGYWKAGDVDAALAAAATRVEAEYEAPYLPHAPLEPMNCTVEFDGRRATVWVPTQVPGFARRAAARALGIDEEQVALEVTYLGGGFGRRLDVDYVAQAAAIARQVPGAPVQVVWSRADDLRHDFYRPACVARFRGGLAADGRLLAWRATSASQAITPQFMPRSVGMPVVGPDKTTAEGSFDVAYEFPAVRVGHVTVDLPVPVGYWRAVGHSHQAFFKESFVDECAHAGKVDPLAFRLGLLQRHPRQRAVLELAAARAGWGRPLGPAPDGAARARGIALHESFGSIVVQVAEVSIGADRRIRVHRVVCAVDCGLPVNPNLIAQQMESGIVFGLSAALHGDLAIEDGRVQASNFHDHPVLRLAECPAIETHVVPSAEAPGGVGEPGQPPIAPAVANAVFALTGQRLRRMPLRLAA